MGFLPELDGLGVPALLTAFDGPIPTEHRELEEAYYEEVALVLVKRDVEGAGRALLDRLADADAPRRCAIISALPEVMLAFLRDAISDDDGQVVARAIDGLTQLHDDDSLTLVRALWRHPRGEVRSAVVRYEARIEGWQAVPLLVDALGDLDGQVRANAVEELAEMECSGALPAIRSLADDQDRLVRETVRDVLTADRRNFQRHRWAS